MGNVIGTSKSLDDGLEPGGGLLDVFILDVGNRKLRDNGGEGTFGFVRVALNLVEGEFDEGSNALLGLG